MRKAAIGAVFVLVCCAQSGMQSQISTRYPYSAMPPGSLGNLDDPTGDVARKTLKWRNDERQKQIAEDGQKLLRLATHLKSEVDQVGRSADAVREAEQIAKLAHGIRDKMIESYRR
ncbi:hypothetical protein [Acidicapsa acidisoli]|uniref:hypothetical protein n=1 Tax=Acidicapsa acidisoli TaxID=1615681 RepID=UPI0021DF4DCD|nr:hypothetical protein [Acidicapsa acidisoli]